NTLDATPPDEATAPLNNGTFPTRLDANGSTEDVYFGTGATPNSLVTITASNGVVLGSGTPGSPPQDASSVFAGVQVFADASGALQFRLLRPTGNGDVNVQATELTGLSQGQATQTYQLPTNVPERHFDFKTAVGAQAVQQGGVLFQPAGPTDPGTTYVGIGP